MRQPFFTDLTDTQWALLRAGPLARLPDPGDLRCVVDALLYQERSRCPWALLPPGFPAPDRLRAAAADLRAGGRWEAVQALIAANPPEWAVVESVGQRLVRAAARRVRRLPTGGTALSAVRPVSRLPLARVRRAVARQVRRLPFGGGLLWPGRAAIQSCQWLLSWFTPHAKLPRLFKSGVVLELDAEYEAAADRFTQVIAVDPVNAPSHFRRAVCRARLGDYPAATADIWAALAMPGCDDGVRTDAHFLLSECLTFQGRFDRGVEHGALARQLRAEGPDAVPADGVSEGLAGYELRAEAETELAEAAINVRADFATAAALYRRRDAGRARYADWLARYAAESLFLSEDWVRNIGHIALLDFWAKMRAMGWGGWKRLVLVAPKKATANRDYLRYFRRDFEVITDGPALPVARHLAATLGRRLAGLLPLPDGTDPYLPEGIGVVQQEWERQGRAPLLSLTPEDAAFGRAKLKALGVPAGAWYVALHARSGGFHREGRIVHQAHRNADIETYLDAVREVTTRGGWVIRLGDKSMEPLPPIPRLVDYARGPAKSPRMDVFLTATARFFVGVTSGLSHVPTTFGTPCLLTNWVSNSLPVFSRHDRFLPKLLRRDGGPTLTFAEWLSRPVRDASYSGESLTRGGYQAIDNTPEELAEAVAEMTDRLAGRPSDSTEDDARRDTFDALARAAGHRGFPPIATAFLRRHAVLLPPSRPALRAA